MDISLFHEKDMLGGAIASTGCNGYGIGSAGDPATILSGELETNFF